MIIYITVHRNSQTIVPCYLLQDFNVIVLLSCQINHTLWCCMSSRAYCITGCYQNVFSPSVDKGSWRDSDGMEGAGILPDVALPWEESSWRWECTFGGFKLDSVWE